MFNLLAEFGRSRLKGDRPSIISSDSRNKIMNQLKIFATAIKFLTLNLRFRIGIVVIDWRIIIFHTRILTFCQSFIFYSARIFVTSPSAAIQETQKEQKWQQHSVETLSQRDLTRPIARLAALIYTLRVYNLIRPWLVRISEVACAHRDIVEQEIVIDVFYLFLLIHNNS